MGWSLHHRADPLPVVLQRLVLPLDVLLAVVDGGVHELDGRHQEPEGLSVFAHELWDVLRRPQLCAPKPKHGRVGEAP
eukprot:15092472-Alexandrium_andersonii.AAC.1